MMYREVSVMRFREEVPMHPVVAAGITAAFMIGVTLLVLVVALLQPWWR
jgi:hypothetical protein